MEFRRPKKTSPFLESLLAAFRETAPFVDEDRLLANDIHAAVAFVQSFEIDSELLFA
jgi:histidine ammonia-lyase